MEITGYSERGIVNALFYEIAYSAESKSLLEKFISKIQFPFIENPELKIKNVELFIEQSFSDFGDADALMLIKTETESVSIFIEAKVKSYQSANWTVEGEYDDFLKGVGTKVSSSNLFTQLYHKVRLVEGLHMSNDIADLQSGLPFPKCSSKTVRKIGQNGVVLNAVKILKNYIDKTYYVAILPDSATNMYNFYNGNKFSRHAFNGVQGWCTDNYGYISWEDVEEFCSNNDLKDTLRVFKFNEGQIYSKTKVEPDLA